MLCVVALDWPCSAQKLSWSWSNPQPHGNDTVDMAWNGTLGVQVCDCGQIYTSPDLINWTPQHSNLTNDLEAVTFFGERIVVTGSYGAVAYSDDGTNFTAGSLNTANWIVGVTASPTLVVAVGDNGALYTSTDGAHWGLQPPPPYIFDNWLLSAAYGNGVFVITGDGGYIATSADGTNWSSSSSVDEYTYGDLEKVAWLNGSGSSSTFPYTGFWIVTDTYNYNGDGYVLYSVNSGSSWTAFTMGVPPTNTLYTVAADNVTTLIAGDTVARLGTASGRSAVWGEEMDPNNTNDIPPATYYASVLQSNGVYVVAGEDGMLSESYPANGNYYWNEPYFSSRNWLWQVTVANGLYVAAGDNATIMTSDDGADWSLEEVPEGGSISYTNTAFLGVGGATNLLLAVGTGGSLAVSPYSLAPVVGTNNGSLTTNYLSTYGVLWYDEPPPVNTTNDLAGICVYSNKFFVVGGNGTLLCSPNGTNNWSALMSNGTNSGGRPAVTTNYLSGIAAATNGLLVLSGNEGTLLTSPNGSNWTARATGTTNWLYHVRSLNGRLVAVGENGALLTSTSGTNWVAANSGVTNWLNDAVWVGNTCYVVGNQGVVLASTNFTTWTRAGSITTKSLEGAATQNGQLVTVGFEGSILRSQVVAEPVNFLAYGRSGGYNVFLVDGPVNQSFTLDASTNLFNWVTGPALDLTNLDGSLIFYQSLPANPPRNQFYRTTSP